MNDAQTAAQPINRPLNPPTGMLRWVALGGAVGPLIFVILVIVNGALYEGYSHTHQAISELGGVGASHAWLQNLNFVVLGLTTIGLAVAIAVAFPRARAGAVLVAVFGLSSCIANAIFPCDEACAGETTVGLLHNLTGLTGFVAAIVGMGLLGRHWRRIDRWRTHALVTLVLLVTAIAGLVVFIVMQEAEDAAAGVPQRIYVGALLLWFALTAVRVSAELSRPTAQTATPGEPSTGA